MTRPRRSADRADVPFSFAFRESNRHYRWGAVTSAARVGDAMSSWLVSKLDIDVLVQLAWVGPLAATGWRPMTRDPDGLGQALWQRNYESNAEEGDPPLPEYGFEPLPIEITAVEGLKHVGCYRYQTETLGRAHEGDDLATLVQELAVRLESELPGYSEAPWGWDDEGVHFRLGRGSPALPERLTPESEARSLAPFSAAGFEPLFEYPNSHAPVEDPGKIQVKFIYPSPSALSGQVRPSYAASIYLCADEDGARTVFSQLVTGWDSETARARADGHVYRYGHTVLSTSDTQRATELRRGHLDTMAANLNQPDDHWSTRDD